MVKPAALRVAGDQEGFGGVGLALQAREGGESGSGEVGELSASGVTARTAFFEKRNDPASFTAGDHSCVGLSARVHTATIRGRTHHLSLAAADDKSGENNHVPLRLAVRRSVHCIGVPRQRVSPGSPLVSSTWKTAHKI